MTTAAAASRRSTDAPLHTGAIVALNTSNLALMTTAAATAAHTPAPESTRPITSSWALPPNISSDPAQAASGSRLAPAATPMASAKGA